MKGISVTIIRPELAPAERERRMQTLRQAVAAICAEREQIREKKEGET